MAAVAQNACYIKRADAFFTVNMPGMIMKDDAGNDVRPTPTIERIIYIECVGKKAPLIASVNYNNTMQLSALKKTVGKIIYIGKRADNSNDIKMIAGKGNTIWKIEFNPANEKTGIKTGCKNITIISRAGTKQCTYNLNTETELAGLPRY